MMHCSIQSQCWDYPFYMGSNKETAPGLMGRPRTLRSNLPHAAAYRVVSGIIYIWRYHLGEVMV